MKTKGKLSVSKAIIEALKSESEYGNSFYKQTLFVRIRSLVGSQYYADDEMIGRTMRKLRAKGVIDYRPKFNGVYTFKINL